MDIDELDLDGDTLGKKIGEECDVHVHVDDDDE
jgi:hypothetical protein